MKKKHTFQEYFNAIGVHTISNPSPLNKALCGLMKHCQLEIAQNQHSNSVECVGRRMDAWKLKTELHNLFEKTVTLKPAEIASNKKIKVLRVEKIEIPQETQATLIKLDSEISKQTAEDNLEKQNQRKKYENAFSK